MRISESGRGAVVRQPRLRCVSCASRDSDPAVSAKMPMELANHSGVVQKASRWGDSEGRLLVARRAALLDWEAAEARSRLVVRHWGARRPDRLSARPGRGDRRSPPRQRPLFAQRPRIVAVAVSSASDPSARLPAQNSGLVRPSAWPDSPGLFSNERRERDRHSQPSRAHGAMEPAGRHE